MTPQRQTSPCGEVVSHNMAYTSFEKLQSLVVAELSSMAIDEEGKTLSRHTNTQLKGLCWKMCTVQGWVVVLDVVPPVYFHSHPSVSKNQCSVQPWDSYERNCFYVNHTQSSVGMNWAGVPSIFKNPIETEQLNRTNENGVMNGTGCCQPKLEFQANCHHVPNNRGTERNPLEKLLTVVRACIKYKSS